MEIKMNTGEPSKVASPYFNGRAWWRYRSGMAVVTESTRQEGDMRRTLVIFSISGSDFETPRSTPVLSAGYTDD